LPTQLKPVRKPLARGVDGDNRELFGQDWEVDFLEDLAGDGRRMEKDDRWPLPGPAIVNPSIADGQIMSGDHHVS
jgi:hypothetical protein